MYSEPMPEMNDEALKEFIANLPYTYSVTARAKEICDNFQKWEGKHVSVAGRVTAVRKAGKLLFIDVLDQSGKIQAYLEFGELGEERFNVAKGFNAGDIIGVEGKVFKTTPGQISIKVDKYQQLAKAIRVLPDKWRGLQDVEGSRRSPLRREDTRPR